MSQTLSVLQAFAAQLPRVIEPAVYARSLWRVQQRVREAEHRAAMQALYSAKFGAADYAEAQRIRAWLRTRPQQHALLAFLNAEDPYE